MKKLLDAPSRRTIEIIEILIFDVEWSTTKELAARIHSSERAISKDLDAIKKNWNHLLNIETSKKYGIRFRNRTTSSLATILKKIINESIAVKWLEKLYLFPFKPIEYYSNLLYTSVSTLKRSIPQINRILNHMDIHLINNNNEYHIEGSNEFYVRKFFSYLFVELNDLDCPPLDINIHNVNQLVKDFLTDFQQKHSKVNVQNSYYSMLIIVSLIRENQGFMADISNHSTRALDADCIAYLLDFFKNISESTIYSSLSLLVKTYDNFESEEQKEKIQLEIEQTTDKILSNFQIMETSHIKQGMNFIIMRMYLEHKLFPFKPCLLFDRTSYFVRSFRKSNYQAFCSLVENLELLALNLNIDLRNEYDALIFFMNLYVPEFSRLSSLKNVLTVSDFSYDHAAYLATRIKSFINTDNLSKIKTDSFSYSDILDNPELLNDRDLIVSTIQIPIANRVILVDDFLTIKSIVKINQLIDSLDNIIIF